MHDLFDFFSLKDAIPLVLLIGLLEFVGSQMGGDNSTVLMLARGFAAAGFFLYVGKGIEVWRPKEASEFLLVGLQGLLAMGMVHGLARIVLPIVIFLHRHLWKEPTNRGRLQAEVSKRQSETARAAREEQRRREREEETWRKSAPERERARKEADEHSLAMADAQTRREDARAACELLFCRYTHVLGERFPKGDFEHFVTKYLGDANPAEYVEQRSSQLQEIILQHVQEIAPPQKPFTIEALAAWYKQTKELIANLPVEDRYKQHQMGQLNERYADLMQALMETLQP